MGNKHSRFNFIYQRQPNENIIYNTFSKALVALDDHEYRQYEELPFADGGVEKQLADNGILIDESFDELGYLKYIQYRTKFAKDTMFLTIAPTMDCNFACPYCYENRHPGKMSAEIQEALVAYVRETVAQGVRKLYISWYGGEPLLYWDVLESLARRISAAAEEGNCALSMHMVTNGYLLTEKIVELLDEIGIVKIQVTLDGLKENHDVRRPLRSGGGTFDRIMENLALFADSPVEVAVRMNVDNQNCKDFRFLKERIAAMGNPNVKVYPSPVEDINKDAINDVSDFMTADEFENFTMKICEEGSLSPVDFAVLDNRYYFCTSEIENCYVVDERGDFYKCWDEIGREEYRCFNIADKETVNYKNIVKYLAYDPFSEAQCAACVFLPLCFGGCKFQRYHLNKSVCGFTRDVLIKYIETAYFQQSQLKERNGGEGL